MFGHSSRMDAYLRIVEVANRTLDVRTVLASSVEEIVAQTDSDDVMILLPDERRTTLEIVYESGGARRTTGPSRFFAIEGSIYGEVFRTGQEHVIDDVLSGLTGPVGGVVPVRSVAALPMRSGPNPVGVLVIGAAEPGVFTGAALETLRRLTGLVGLATSNALVHNLNTRRSRQLVALNRLAAAVVATLSRDGVVSAALSHVEDATEFGAPAVYEIDGAGRRLSRLALRGYSPAAAAATASLPLYGAHINLVQALQRRRPLLWWLADESLEGAPELQALRDDGFRTFVMIPMSARGRLCGALTLASRRERALDEGHAAVLMAAGNIVGTALRNAEYYENARNDAVQLERVVRERTAALENRNARLRHVTSWLTHDLKRPLRSILALSEILTDELAPSADEEGRDLITRVRSAAQSLSERLAELVDFVHIGSGRVRPEPVDLDAVLDGCLDDVAADIERLGARVERVDTWPTVTSERGLARRLIGSIIENALKYRVSDVSPVLRFGMRGAACYVADNGPGVPAERRAALFDIAPWRKADGPAPGRSTSLFQAREIVDTFGGELRYEPNPDGGSVFLFELPPAQQA